jgi:hypothetical protein
MKDLEFKAVGVYRIPCECGEVHVRQGVGVIKTGHKTKSAGAEGSVSTVHCTDFGGISVSHRPLTHCGRVTKICVFNTVKLGTSASSP